MTVIHAPFLDDPALQKVLAALGDHGHQALIVGGAVRNALLGLAASDVDIATSALPDQTIAIATAAGLRAVPTGQDHGTITVVADGHSYEVTTFRRDVQTDGRHAIVAFSDDLRDDAARRDFTMNAIYATGAGEIIDPQNGVADLSQRRLRFVGDPHQRIAEDYLRILRFYRFHAWYGAQGRADPSAVSACAKGAHGLARISHERIGHEMRKLLAAADPSESIAMMVHAGVLAQVLLGADAHDLPGLIAAEHDHGTGALPAWPRRLAALRPHDAATALRLSRDETRVQEQILQALTMPAHEAAYRFGRAIAAQAALIAAARGAPPIFGWCHSVARAADAKFPISAADLMPALNGPALGAGLKRAEAAWIGSEFQLERDELIGIAENGASDA